MLQFNIISIFLQNIALQLKEATEIDRGGNLAAALTCYKTAIEQALRFLKGIRTFV